MTAIESDYKLGGNLHDRLGQIARSNKLKMKTANDRSHRILPPSCNHFSIVKVDRSREVLSHMLPHLKDDIYKCSKDGVARLWTVALDCHLVCHLPSQDIDVLINVFYWTESLFFKHLVYMSSSSAPPRATLLKSFLKSESIL